MTNGLNPVDLAARLKMAEDRDAKKAHLMRVRRSVQDFFSRQQLGPDDGISVLVSMLIMVILSFHGRYRKSVRDSVYTAISAALERKERIEVDLAHAEALEGA